MACALAVFLSACADGNGTATSAEADSASESGAGGLESDFAGQTDTPMSATALNENPYSTLSYAQAVAAGVIDPVVINENATDNVVDASVGDAVSAGGEVEQPTIGAANPDQASAQPDVATDEADNSDSGGSVAIGESPDPSDGDDAADSAPASDNEQTADAGAPDSDTADAEVSSENSDPNAAGVDSNSSTTEPVDMGEMTSEESTIGQRFSSRTSPGFEGEVTEDGSVLVSWEFDRTARGYNVYRDGEYHLSVFENEWLDTDTVDDSYYYEIEAFDFADTLTRIATGLTVKVSGSGREGPEAKTSGVDLNNYEMVFSDEFRGDSLDFSKWGTSYLWGPNIIINSEEQYYVDTRSDPDFGFDPFTFDGENLIINSIETPPELSDKALGQPYLSGVINSRDAFNFTYGYAETRAKTPYGRGYWSAFWLLNTMYDGGDEPEIDIMEHIGHNQDTAYHTYHYYDNSGDTSVLHSTDSMPVTGIDFTEDFHTFAVDWSPGLLVFYVDGYETHRISDPRVSSVDMYVIANTALGGWWPGSPDATTEFPGQYLIDYIRVYQRIEPYDDRPFFNDAPSQVQTAVSRPGTSPSRRPPIEDWPEGYPTR